MHKQITILSSKLQRYQNINIELDDIIPNPLNQGRDSDIYKNIDQAFCPPIIAVICGYHPEYSAGGTRRGVCHDFVFRNININGNHIPTFVFEGYDEEHKTSNILVENIFHNGKLLESISNEGFKTNKHTENILHKTTDCFSQIKKNSVSSKGQLNNTDLVRFENPYGSGIRVMFVGNSITLHGIAPAIGWNSLWGMAASEKEKDYVHILMNKIIEKHPDAAFCICQVANWEREYKNGDSTHHLFENARVFGADIIIMRSVENCPGDNIDAEQFKRSLDSLLCYLDSKGTAKFVLSTAFWHHPLDFAIEEYAKEKKLPLALLGDLGEKDEMKAIGLFEHEGVANHPGDLGMKNMAERLYSKLIQYL